MKLIWARAATHWRSCNIATGKFKEAVDLLSYEAFEEVDIYTAFNYAMASWGLRGSADAGEFIRVIELHEFQEKFDRSNDANYLQCIGLAYWVVEDTEKAMEYARLALKAVDNDDETFTCWRYSIVSANAFRDDIVEMIDFFDGNTLMAPPFISN